MGWGRNWFKPPKEPRPERRGPYTAFKEGGVRKQRAADIYKNRAALTEVAVQLRQSTDCYCLHAATLVDAAIEALDEGLVNLCKDEPADKVQYVAKPTQDE